MTEEIIVDGVNVAGCEFYLQDDKYSCDLSFINQEKLCKCDDIQDCYYKQLKRLEQENKELRAYKDINEDFKKAWDELNEKYKQLRSALEKIRKIADIIYNTNCNYVIESKKILEKCNEVLND